MKTLPFDLQKARAGHPLVTRDGNHVTGFRYCGNLVERTYPYLAEVDNQTHTYTADGRYDIQRPGVMDLLLAAERSIYPGVVGLRTRGGEEVRIYATDGGSKPRNVGNVHGAYLDPKIGWIATTWYADGSYISGSSDVMDIVLPKPWNPPQAFWDWLPREYNHLKRQSNGAWKASSTVYLLDILWLPSSVIEKHFADAPSEPTTYIRP